MNFLKNNKRFSFKIGKKSAWNFLLKKEDEQRGNEYISSYYFQGGLKVTNISKKFDDFGAYEWVNYFENIGEMPTEIISELWDCDCAFPIEHEDERNNGSPYCPDRAEATKIYAPTGSDWSTKEFYCDVDELRSSRRINHIYPGETKKYSASGGRSSEAKAPFFDIHKNGNGYIFAIGWSGQWNAEISRDFDDIVFKSKIEDTAFRLMPGEKIRTSSVVVMPYSGNVVSAHNVWRRLIKEHFSPIGTGIRPMHSPLSACIWGGMTTKSVMERIDIIQKNNFPFEYIWMDAGWYGIDTEPSSTAFDGDWSWHTGDWRVSKKIHPQGLLDVSKAIHDAGMKFLLWFEPERVIRTVPDVVNYPGYFFSNDNPEGGNRMLNLGNSNAWKHCFETLSSLIEKLRIDCLRIDFNYSPLEFWRYNDDSDRCGICEIKYINGLYKLWDKLLERFPELLIDNCASGGRRIDIETMRRSVPLWRSDFQCTKNYDSEAAQCHNLCFNFWMPYSGTASGSLYDEYRLRSAYSAALCTNWSQLECENFCDTDEKTKFVKKYTKEYLKVRPYFSEDFYPLTSAGDTRDAWCAAQFDRPSKNDGIVEVFRREDSPYETARFMLSGIQDDKKYVFSDADGGEFELEGEVLAREGLKISISEKRKAKIYFYRAV